MINKWTGNALRDCTRVRARIGLGVRVKVTGIESKISDGFYHSKASRESDLKFLSHDTAIESNGYYVFRH